MEKKNAVLQTILIAVGILVAGGVFLYYCAPRSETEFINVYTGQRWVRHEIFGLDFTINKPTQPHTVWAKKHIKVKQKDGEYRMWRSSGNFLRTQWFDGYFNEQNYIGLNTFFGLGQGFDADIVLHIYNSRFLENEKLEFLHEYHNDVADSKAPYRKLIMLESLLLMSLCIMTLSKNGTRSLG